MPKYKRIKIYFLPPTSNRPPTPTAANIEISYNNKLSIAIKATKDKLQIFKEMPIFNLQ